MPSKAIHFGLDRESRSVGLYLFLPISAIVLLAILSLYCLYDIRQHEIASTETNRATAAINEVFRGLLNAETGTRGFMITEKEIYLEPYYAAVSQLPGKFEELSLVGHSEKITGVIEETKSLSERKLLDLDTSIQSVRNGKTEEAIDRIKENNGKELMDKIRVLVRQVEVGFRQDLSLQERALWRSFLIATVLATTAFLIALFAIVFLFVRTGKEMALRNSGDLLRQQRTTQLQSFADIASRIVTCPDVDSIVGIALNEFRHLIGTKEALLKFKTGETIRVERGVVASGIQQSNPAYLESVFELVQLLSRSEATFFRHRADIVNVTKTTSSNAWRVCGDAIESVLTAPILNLNRDEIGRFVLLGKLNGDFNENDLSIVAQLAFILSSAIENTRLTEQASIAAIRKDEFLAMLGHELRNPLAGILTGSEILLSETELSIGPESHAITEVIHRQAYMMKHIVDDLLDVSRIGQGKVTLTNIDCDITSVTRHAVEDHQKLHPERSILLESADSSDSIIVHGDQIRLNQCVTNLLNNACKFSASDEKIVVKLEKVRSIEPTADSVSIEVRDQGIGLNEDELQSIFQLFFQSNETIDRSQGGLGIGLTLAKGLVEMHGGRLTATSLGRNRGSVFTINLPIKRILGTNDIGMGSTPYATTQSNVPHSKPIHILAIDDRADALFPIRVLMTRDGHQVAEATDGLEGIKMAKALLPDIILCDIGLPGLMNGYAVAQMIRADRDLKHIYLVALSGYSQPSDRKRAQSAGFDFHVAKPIQLSMLRNLVSNRPKF